jgi:hypothetical protein
MSKQGNKSFVKYTSYELQKKNDIIILNMLSFTTTTTSTDKGDTAIIMMYSYNVQGVLIFR